MSSFPSTQMPVPPKILFFYQDFGAMGGIERYIEQIAQLQAGAYKPVIVCSADTPFYHRMAEQGFQVYGLPNRPWLAKSFLRTLDLPSFIETFKILKREKPDLIHVHIGLLENLLFKAMGYPVVNTFHGYGTLFSMQNARNPLKKLFKHFTRLLFRKTASYMDALLFVSGAEQNRMLHEGYIGHDNPGDVCRNGIPVTELRLRVESLDPCVVKKKLGLPPNARCISFINRLDTNKDPFEFIRLAMRLTEDLPKENLHFLIAGDGPLAETVQAQCNLLPNMHYLGFQPDVTSLLAASEACIYTARHEGFGLGLLEAMAGGTPCIAYASGGARELLDVCETASCLVPNGSFDALLQKTRELLSMPPAEKAGLREALKKRAMAFDIGMFIRKLGSVYRRLLPTVSVILPVYQGERTILKAVRSVLNQTYPHLQLIVVDDGSTDGTVDKLSSIRDPRLQIIRQPNSGVAAARNHAFRYADGDYIGFIDADDVWLPEKLMSEVKTLRQVPDPECLLYSGYYAVDDQDRLTHLPPVGDQSGDLSRDVLRHEGIFLPSTALIHRAVFERVGGFRTGCYHEDRAFFIEACRDFPAYPTGKRLTIYRQSEAGRCRRILSDYETALAAELSIMETLQDRLSESELAELKMSQLRNLLFRFLMYGQMASARNIEILLKQEPEVPSLLSAGKKGGLAWLSLRTGINFLMPLRLLIQQLTKTLLGIWWNAKTAFLSKAEMHVAQAEHCKTSTFAPLTAQGN